MTPTQASSVIRPLLQSDKRVESGILFHFFSKAQSPAIWPWIPAISLQYRQSAIFFSKRASAVTPAFPTSTLEPFRRRGLEFSTQSRVAHCTAAAALLPCCPFAACQSATICHSACCGAVYLPKGTGTFFCCHLKTAEREGCIQHIQHIQCIQCIQCIPSVRITECSALFLSRHCFFFLPGRVALRRLAWLLDDALGKARLDKFLTSNLHTGCLLALLLALAFSRRILDWRRGHALPCRLRLPPEYQDQQKKNSDSTSGRAWIG